MTLDSGLGWWIGALPAGGGEVGSGAMMLGEEPLYSDLNPEEDFAEGSYTDRLPHANEGVVEVVEVAP